MRLGGGDSWEDNLKRILFIVPHFPYPPHQGGALRNFGMIEGLAQRGHEVALLSFRDADQPAPDEGNPLLKLCQPLVAVPAPQRPASARLRDLLAGHADMARRFWSEEFAAALRDISGGRAYDAILVSIEMADYLPALHRDQPGALLIYDALNAEYDLQWRIALQDLQMPTRWPLAAYSLIQTARLRRVEAGLCRNVSHVLACSLADSDKLAQLDHATPITTIPNAIRVKDYQGKVGQAAIPHPALVFTGKMDFRPNVDAALWLAGDILPRIRQRLPGAHLTIVGQKPHSRLDALRSRDDVTLTGFVPDVKPYLAAADVYVAPLRMGSGTRFKLLEAMAMGKPIVSTRLGAEGLSVQDGREMRLADRAEEFAGAVIDLLNDERRRRALGEQARRLVSDSYDWGAVIPKLEAIFDG